MQIKPRPLEDNSAIGGQHRVTGGLAIAIKGASWAIVGLAIAIGIYKP
jgi:hypothetical protein